MKIRKLIRKLFFRSLFLGLGLAVFGLSLAVTTHIYLKRVVQGEVIEVPDLTGMSIEEARKELRDMSLRLTWRDDQRIFSSIIEADHVYAQIPRPGSRIKADRLVEVTLSAGPEKQLIPSLKGETLNFSKTLLKRSKLDVSVVSRMPYPEREKGRILTQHPPAGDEIGVKQGVSLLVSDGVPESWLITPNLTQRDFSQVKSFLEANNIRYITKYSLSNENLGPVVLDQIPKAGYPFKRSQTITLIVNKDF